MYNGRQHIQTELIKVKNNPFRDTEMGKSLSDMSSTKFPAMKNTWQKDKIYKSKRAPV